MFTPAWPLLEAALRDGMPVHETAGQLDTGWVDDFLLSGPADEVCLWLDGPMTRGELADRVARRDRELTAAGLTAGGTVSLRMAPSMEYVISLLGAWRAGAQVSLLDHRLTDHEVGQVLARLKPQLLVSAQTGRRGAATITGYDEGVPASTGHALLQLSSGSTGPSKVIGRTAANLRAEVTRYQQIDGVPLPGERVVLLSSMVHVLGLVGGLLYCLHNRTQLVVPRALTTEAVITAVADDPAPTTVIGVPFHIDFFNVARQDAKLPQLRRMTVGGELVRPAVRQAFVERYQVPLGVMYGMTEVGVIATDLFGDHWPALDPAPGMRLREESGQLLLAMDASPYVGLTDPTRWVDGWLYTRDAGAVDPLTGRVTVRGRLDSQVSVGGLKVDLTEVEQTIDELPGVAEVVVAFDEAIEAFVALDDTSDEPGLKGALAARLAPYKRPRRLHVVQKLPRTATGKLVRSLPALREVVAQERRRGPNERSGADV